MAISLENLSHVTSLAQLRLDREGQLETRSALGTLGHRIMDAFRSLSAEGRNAISSRNTDLLSAMMDAVDESRRNGEVREREADANIGKALDRLIAANTASYASALTARIMKDPDVAALPEKSLCALRHALASIAENAPRDEWQSRMNALRDTFLGRNPEGFDLERGVQTFGDDLRKKFLGAQQKNIEDFGLHRSFYTDIDRSGISSIGDTKIDPGKAREAMPNEKERRAHYCAILTDFLTKDASYRKGDERFLPFLSMAATQDGTNAACPQLSMNCGDRSFSTLTHLGIGPHPSKGHVDTDTSITRDSANPRNILVRSNVSMELVHKGTPALKLKTSITMRIDLDAEPTVQQVDGKQVFLPAFTLENASTRFTTEGI